jgi:hypothetical protein
MVHWLMVYWLTNLLVEGLPADSLPADQNLTQDILSLPANDLLVDKSTGQWSTGQSLTKFPIII